VLYYVQLYPRADFWHLLPLAAVSLIVTVGTATRAVAAVGGNRRWPAQVLLGGLVVVAAVRWVPNAAVVTAALSAVPRDTLRLERANVRWDLVDPPALRAVPAVVEALAGASQVIGFPALAVFNFLTGVPSPLRDDYFFPGVPSPGEDLRIASALAESGAARVVVLREPLGFFPAALTAHAVVDDAIRRTFPVVKRIGPYEVREAAP
jgi:hypothetical protein